MHRRWVWSLILVLPVLPGCGGGDGGGSSIGDHSLPLGGFDLSRLVIPASSRLYMLVSGIEGEVTELPYGGWIELSSMQFGFRNTAVQPAAGGAASGRPVADLLEVAKGVDKASPKLAEALMLGKMLRDVTVVVATSSIDLSREVYRVELHNCQILSLRQGIGSGQQPLTTESLSFNYDQVKLIYQPQKPDGTSDGPPVQFGWDLKKNKPN